MFDIIDQEDINKIVEFLKRFPEDEKELCDFIPMGKDSNIVLPYDTGLGLTVKDLYKNDPELFKMWKNLNYFTNMTEKIVFGD